jgi:hypothetical protein
MKIKTTVHKYHRRNGTPVKKHSRSINVEFFKNDKSHDQAEWEKENIKAYGEKIDKDLVQKKLTPRKARALQKEEKQSSEEYKKMGLKSLSKDERRHSEFFEREARDLKRVKSSKEFQNTKRNSSKSKKSNPKKWIQEATTEKKKGALHRQLGIPVKNKIPYAVLHQISNTPVGERIYINTTGQTSNTPFVTVTPLMKRRVNFALNVRK